MVLFLKRLHLLLFLFLSFGVQAQIGNHQKLFVYNAILFFDNSASKPFTLSAFFTIVILTFLLFFQYYRHLKTKSLLSAQKIATSSQEINTILLEQELKLLRTFVIDEDKERIRVSQEMYNSIGQKLVSIKLQVNHLNNSNLKNINTINLRLEETYQQFKNLSSNFIPKKFSENKFCEILESYLSNISVACELNISFLTYHKKEINELNESVHCHVFKIIQELVSNTIKYTQASRIEIQLNILDNTIHLIVQDNGLGYDSSNYIENTSFELETRIKNLNASAVIDSNIENRRVITIEIPSLVQIPQANDGIVKGINIKNQLSRLKSKM